MTQRAAERRRHVRDDVADIRRQPLVVKLDAGG
jgi:hypothetical protein